jgi:ribosomal protein S18 acetylase RimI-like enzyme
LGIGKHLVFSILKEIKINSICCIVEFEEENIIKFYEKLGFKEKSSPDNMRIKGTFYQWDK